MRRRSVTLILVGLLVVSAFLAGCRRSAAPPVGELTPEDEATAAMQEAQDNTEGAESVEATEVPATEVPADTVVESEAPEATEEILEPTPEPTATPEPEPLELPTAIPTPEQPILEEEGTATQLPSTPGTYVVKPGDNLFRIALNHGLTLQELSQANNITNPALIYVGQQLTIPHAGSAAPAPSTPPSASGCSTVYVVQPGDNLFRIALRYNISQAYLAQANGISNPSLVYVGQQLCIP